MTYYTKVRSIIEGRFSRPFFTDCEFKSFGCWRVENLYIVLPIMLSASLDDF